MKLNKFEKRIVAIYDELDELIGKLEEKQNAIEEKAIEHDRDMTEREEEKYAEIDDIIFSVRECMDNLDYAVGSISEWCD